MKKRSNFIMPVITLLSAILIAVIIFFIKQNKYKGKTIYLDTKVHTENYDLNFSKWPSKENGRDAIMVEIIIKNNTSSKKDFVLKDVSVKDDKSKIHKCSAVTLTIDPASYDYYNYGYYCDNNNDTTKYRLHFNINGDKYNLFFRNEVVE